MLVGRATLITDAIRRTIYIYIVVEYIVDQRACQYRAYAGTMNDGETRVSINIDYMTFYLRDVICMRITPRTHSVWYALPTMRVIKRTCAPAAVAA